MRGKLPIRGTDAHGSGHYGASRGNRIHRGIDYACPVGTGIYPIQPGKVTKIGKPYADDPDTPNINELETYDYVQVTDSDGVDHRYFYLDPLVRIGAIVYTSTIIGTTQDLQLIYPGITPHCHYEAKRNGEYIDLGKAQKK